MKKTTQVKYKTLNPNRPKRVEEIAIWRVSARSAAIWRPHSQMLRMV